ncbi:MAG: aminotransferase class I/II-fold pyridoxal phosphate-dependent enzyme [Bryobacteraceae bacterium]|nr:aminotransferase class I/II-fold pyridoxal phosphate-dependent enzyme [Bryobacteraceae bacterium]
MSRNADRFLASRTAGFTESVIREMTRLALRHGAVNLAQGFPDFPAPEEVKQAAMEAIAADINQYAVTWGAAPLRNAIADYYRRFYGMEVDPDAEITVVCGSTEGMIASLLATVNPGEEVILFEPFYENYGPDAELCGAVRRPVPLRPPDWTFDLEELRAAFSPKTKAIIINNPHNPTGKVFTVDELMQISGLCLEFGALCISDEIYEHIIYDGATHVPAAALPWIRDRAIVVNSVSKTFSVTGWRVGWVIAPPGITASIRKVHDFLTVGAPAPLQQAAAAALRLPDEYFHGLKSAYAKRRAILSAALLEAGLALRPPEGAYYILADIRPLGLGDGDALCRRMVEEAGVAAVPGSSFFRESSAGAAWIRFCFCKKYETLEEAGRLLKEGLRRL